MAMGGIRDHLGGGFHRYSVDRFWLIPHFEKMLYDNGQLASVYSEAYKLTGDEEYRQVVEEMLAFVEREMTGDHGGFYSALDADSEGEEGRFYRWEKEQLEEELAAADYSLFAKVYGMNDEPNFELEYYVPMLSETRSELALKYEMSRQQLEEKLQPIRQQLFTLRAQRVRPFTDDKVLTSWNGLMIRGFADAGRLLEQPRYIETAEKAATFVLEQLSDEKGRLLRTFRGGEAKLNAYLVDYAFLVEGLLALHRATGKKAWLDEADRLMTIQLELYWDDENSGFFFTSDDHESLLARGKNPVDGAQPSGNSVSVQNLVYLARELDNEDYLEHAERTIRSVSGILSNSPSASPRMAIAVGQMLVPAEVDNAMDPGAAAIDFWNVFAKGDLSELGGQYADEILLKAGSEFLKPEWGIAEPGDRAKGKKVARSDLMKAYKLAITELGKEKWQTIFGSINKNKISTKVLQNKHLLLTVKTGPGDDYLEFELALNKGRTRWLVVSEFTDF
jgi:uncharacterized protein YyaL (SSP411 family)